jgi:LysM repeat protein
LFVATVQPGDTLSGIAAAHGESLRSLEADNPQFSGNPDLIYVGQHVNIGGGGGTVVATSSGRDGDGDYDHDTSDATPSAAPTYHASPSSTTYTPTPAASSGSLSVSNIDNIPGVPSSFVKCVAFRESTNGTNQAYNGGVYGIITASGYNVNGQSLAAQKAAFSSIYHNYGGKAWAADGCPGT